MEHSGPLSSDPRDAFIARQIAGLRELGLSQDALAREEALLRGGAQAQRVFAALFWGARPVRGGPQRHDGD